MDEKKKTSPNNIDQIRNLIFGDQIQDYARRKGMDVGEVERWLAPYLAYR